MSAVAQRPSARAGVVGVIAPISQAAGTVTTSWIDATTFHNYMAVIQLGVLGASATIDAKIRQAQDNTGTNVKDVTGKAITTMTQAGTNMSGDQATIDIKQEDLDIANGFKWIELSMTVGVASSLIAAAVFGFDPRYDFAFNVDSATVLQNV